MKFVKATADFANAERALEPEFQSESRKKKEGDKRTYGPVEAAIDGKEDTAWGIDAGPGRRNVPRKAVFIPEKPLTFTNGVELNFRLVQNHGGDNSDDNQTHNLGRFRMSVTGATANSSPIPCRPRCATSSRGCRATNARRCPGGCDLHLLADDGPGFQGNQREDRNALEAVAGGHADVGAGGAAGIRGPADEMRTTHVLKRGDWLKPDSEVGPGVPSVFLHPLPSGAPTARGLPWRSGSPTGNHRPPPVSR